MLPPLSAFKQKVEVGKMGKFIDLTGRKFGKLTVIKRTGSKRNSALWLCQCDCGNTKEIISPNLIHGASRSCGCLQREVASKLNKPKKNKYKIIENHVEVYLSNSKNIMLCDISDWNTQKDFTWFMSKNGYVITHKTINRKQTPVYFHLEIMSRKTGFVVDHINRNRLDNRKENLRIVDYEINAINSGMYKSNTSGIKGVHKRKDTGKWTSHITVNHKTIWLGCYSSLEDAKQARKEAEKKYFEPLLGDTI